METVETPLDPPLKGYINLPCSRRSLMKNGINRGVACALTR